MSLYEICLLITKDGDENFDIARLQIDNTFNVRTERFMKKEEKEIMEAKLKTKN